MKIVRINKTTRNKATEHFLVLFNEPYTNDEINSLVEEWCDNDPSGMSYGYSYTWEFEEDERYINIILKDKIKTIERKIESLEDEKIKLKKYLK